MSQRVSTLFTSEPFQQEDLSGGSMMVRNGSCYKCGNSGGTSDGS
jgi:hypothetical protein